MIETITKNGRFIMATPFNRDFVADIKNLGGRWNAENKTWSVAEQDAERAREILRTHYGLDGTEDTQATVTLLVDANAYKGEREINLAGTVIARRWHRDSQPALGENVVISEGKFPWSGGSHAHPCLQGEDVVLEWREVPSAVADKLIADGEYVTIVEEPDMQEDPDMGEKYTISNGQNTSYTGSLEELREQLLTEAIENNKSLEEWEDQEDATWPDSITRDEDEEIPTPRPLTTDLLVELAAHVWDMPERQVQLTTEYAPITAGEFLARLHWLGVGLNDFSRMAGINARTVRAWASGRMTIPATIRAELDTISQDVDCLTTEVVLQATHDNPVIWPPKADVRVHYPGYEQLPEQAILNAVARAVVDNHLTAY